MLTGVVASSILGASGFIDFIKQKYLTNREIEQDIPALKALTQKVSLPDICDAVDKKFTADPGIARSAKIYLCHRYTGKKLMMTKN